MQQVKIQKADFANKYFYIFGLNLKFCKGIKEYKKKLSPGELMDQKRLIWNEFFKICLKKVFLNRPYYGMYEMKILIQSSKI